MAHHTGTKGFLYKLRHRKIRSRSFRIPSSAYSSEFTRIFSVTDCVSELVSANGVLNQLFHEAFQNTSLRKRTKDLRAPIRPLCILAVNSPSIAIPISKSHPTCIPLYIYIYIYINIPMMPVSSRATSSNGWWGTRTRKASHV